MELKQRQKEKTLAGLFLKFVTLFCVNTILIFAVVFLLMLCAASAGVLLPANDAEERLRAYTPKIQMAGRDLQRWIPKGCTYGLYSADGVWQEGSFLKQEKKSAWEHYEKGYIYAEYKGYYRFIEQENGNVCIVKYRLIMRYANDELNELLPAPELMMPIFDVILFLVHAVWLSKRFARRVRIQLKRLQSAAEMIAGNDLEFDMETSDIRELNEILASFGRLKDALRDSLKRQWDMETQKQEQLSALAHDIKTPLTIIKGNAELLKEQELSEESSECAAYILANTNELEKYLETMRQMLLGREEDDRQTVLPCANLAELFADSARQLAAAEKIPVCFDISSPDGAVCCKEADVLRAWNNLIGNAAEYTDRQKGIVVSVRSECRKQQRYFVAEVRDFGVGFSSQDLQFAAQEFYSGDASRHDRKHFGLGLFIAKKFAESQGGFLEYGNCKDGAGANAALWLKSE